MKDVSDIIYASPEVLNPELMKPHKVRVLILASYCGDDNSECSEHHPCNDCLRLCNVAEVVVGCDDIIGQFELAGVAK